MVVEGLLGGGGGGGGGAVRNWPGPLVPNERHSLIGCNDIKTADKL